LSSDVPRAPWKAIVVGEIIGPICLAVMFVVCYLFVKSFPVNGTIQPGLLRIAIISLGPIVWNMAFLITLFLISVFLGPCVSRQSYCFYG
jgi:1,3-beta-glucan synthase